MLSVGGIRPIRCNKRRARVAANGDVLAGFEDPLGNDALRATVEEADAHAAINHAFMDRRG